MLKKILLALGISLITSTAFAACPAIPMVIKDGNNTSQNVGTTTAADGSSCVPKVDADTSSQLHADITAPPTLGSASGGWTPKLLNALSTTVTAIKSSAAGQLGLLYCNNPNSSVEYIQVFDVATAGGVTLGTTTPKLSFAFPATTAAGYALSLVGVQFANGIQVAATTTATGSSAPSTALDCNGGFN